MVRFCEPRGNQSQETIVQWGGSIFNVRPGEPTLYGVHERCREEAICKAAAARSQVPKVIIWDNPLSARPGLGKSAVFPTRINFDPTYLIRQIGLSPDLALSSGSPLCNPHTVMLTTLA